MPIGQVVSMGGSDGIWHARPPNGLSLVPYNIKELSDMHIKG